MDTRMKRRQAARKKPKRKRKLLMMFVLIFSCLFLVTTAYAVMQFQAGKNEAQDNLTENEMIGTDELDDEVVEVKEPENDEPINVLLIGIDTSEQEPARTDTIMIGQYDAKNGDARLASIMRDTYVEIPGHMNNKINYAFAAGGADLLRETIEQNFDLDIHYYAMVNFNGFVNVVDTVAPDGIEVNVERRMYYRDSAANMTIDFQPGVQTLSGEDILKYVRFRKDSENDFGRVERQQQVLALLKDELLSFSGLTRIPRLIGSVEPYLETNIGLSQMLSIGRDFALKPINDFETLRIPLDNSYHDEYYSHAGAVLEIDKTKNIQAITDFFSGKKVLANDTEAEDNEQES